jgi:hypothetical protein
MKLKPGILVLFLILGASPAVLHAAAVDATVAKVTGTAYVTDSSGKSKPLAAGDLIPAGSSIHTDAGSSVGLKLVPGATTVVAPGSDITLSTLDYSQTPAGATTRKIKINLRLGTIFSSLAKHDGSSDFRVSTPDGVAAARGTDWAVSFSPTTGITVSTVDGSVQLTFPNGSSVVVSGGTSTTSPDGTTVSSSTLTQDQIDAIVNAIEAAGFTLSTGTTPGGGGDNGGGGNFNNNSGNNNPANIVSPNQ